MRPSRSRSSSAVSPPSTRAARSTSFAYSAPPISPTQGALHSPIWCLMHGRERWPHRAGGRERAEHPRPAGGAARLAVRADELEPREALVGIEPHHQERLVVLEPDVVRRLVGLDQRVLEQQRLLLGARD